MTDFDLSRKSARELARLVRTRAVSPLEVLNALRASGHWFYTDVGPGGAARLMCSWDTMEDDVSALVSDIERLLAGSK